MKKVNQFWQDIELALSTLMLRHLLRKIIEEGRQEIRSNTPCPDLT